MTAPVYQTCMASTAVTDIIGNRLYEDEAEQGVAKPYAVFQHIGGDPENYINQTPDLDSHIIQISGYAKEQEDRDNLLIALRDAIEPVAHIIAWRGKGREQATRLYSFSFDVEWMVNR